MSMGEPLLDPFGPAGSPGASGLSRTELFDAMSNRRRSHVIDYLTEHEGDSVDLRTLSDYVTAKEQGVAISQIDTDKRRSVYVSLHQTHLPKLDTYNVIEYDQRRGEVAVTTEYDRVKTYLESVPEDDIPWSYVYASLSGLSALLLTTAAAGVPPFAGLDGFAVSVFILLLFGIATVLNAVEQRSSVFEFSGADTQ